MLVCKGKSVEESTLSTDWSLNVWAAGERMLWEPYLAFPYIFFTGMSDITRERHEKRETTRKARENGLSRSSVFLA